MAHKIFERLYLTRQIFDFNDPSGMLLLKMIQVGDITILILKI
jgi:hypothetical protein